LHGGQGAERFFCIGTEIAHAILVDARQSLFAPAEENERQHDDGHDDHHDGGEFGAGGHQQAERADGGEGVADPHRDGGADQGLQHADIGGHARQEVAGAGGFEIAGGEGNYVVEQVAPQIGPAALAEPGDQREAQGGSPGQGGDDHEHGEGGMVEGCAAMRPKPLIDQVFEALADAEHEAGGGKQRGTGASRVPGIGF
jgi:hypothetical protein